MGIQETSRSDFNPPHRTTINRPRLFLSAVSAELHTIRQTVAVTVRTLGFYPVSQDDFPTGHGELGQWLRTQIDSCEGLVQIVGEGYGDGLAIRDKLATGDPGNTVWQRDLSYSFYQISTLQAQQQLWQDALVNAEASLKIDERLSQLDLTNATWQAALCSTNSARNNAQLRLTPLWLIFYLTLSSLMRSFASRNNASPSGSFASRIH
jgi:hypothetical protein